MRSLMQNNVNLKHQSLKGCQHFFFLFILVIFLEICQVPLSKNPLNVEVATRKALKERIRQHCVPYLSMNVLAKIHGKPSILHTLFRLLIHLKMRNSLKKRVQVFAFCCNIFLASTRSGKFSMGKNRFSSRN